MRIASLRYACCAVLLATTHAVAADLSRTVQQAEQAIDRGDFTGAIATLERALPDSQGNAQVLALLRRAYRGEIRSLVVAGDRKAAEKYLDHLRLIENVPGPRRDEEQTASRTERPPQAPASVASGASSDPVHVITPPAEPLVPEPAVTANAVGPSANADSRPRVKVVGVRPAATATEADPSSGAQVRGWLRQADALFMARQYAEAGRLYAHVNSSSASANQAARDRWTYCRLVVAVDQINLQPASEEEWSAIEMELKSIREVLPDNEYLQSLLQLAESRGTRPAPAGAGSQTVIRASSPDPKGQSLLAGLASRIGLSRIDDAARALWRRGRSGAWQVLTTSNYRIHTTDESLAGPIADAAEATRIELYRTWFGKPPEADWEPKCDIFIHDSADAYARVTGQGKTSPGHSATGIDRGRIISRRVDLRRDGPDLLHAVLPHEITHVVMADRFTNQPLPRWADEGVAVLTEPAEKKFAHLRNLGDASPRGKFFPAKQLMTMTDYPPGNLWGMFYAESVSLVDFLVARGGPPKFIEFMAASHRDGLEAALKQSYGFASFDELEKDWSRGRTAQLAAANGR